MSITIVYYYNIHRNARLLIIPTLFCSFPQKLVLNEHGISLAFDIIIIYQQTDFLRSVDSQPQLHGSGKLFLLKDRAARSGTFELAGRFSPLTKTKEAAG